MEIERRFAELRAAADGAAVEGVAMPYGTAARIWDAFNERVDPGAFAGSLGDITANRMHDARDVFARTGGGGLVLDDSATRLHLRAEIPEYRVDLRDQVKRQILRGMSVEMRVIEESWPSADERVIHRAELFAVALVDRPAYTDTTVMLAKRAKAGGLEVRWWPLALT